MIVRFFTFILPKAKFVRPWLGCCSGGAVCDAAKGEASEDDDAVHEDHSKNSYKQSSMKTFSHTN